MINFARSVSFLLSPLFVLLPIPYILVSRFTDNHIYAIKWMIFSYIFILAIAVFIGVGVLLGIFSNFDVSKREQRPLLFTFTALIIFSYLVSLLIFDGPKILFMAVFALILGLIIIAIVNQWVKASIHVAILTSSVLLMIILYKGYYFLFLLLIPLLSWARVKMREHTILETVVGSIFGVLLTVIVYVASRYFLIGMIYN
ncbi:MAG: hypothetical protein AAB583_03005 [Patescibacteria group bacterium]